MQVYPEPAPPSPVENLRWLEDHLDVTYSPVCCSYNAGTTTLLLRLPNAEEGNGVAACPASSVGSHGRDAVLDVLGWRREGAREQNLVDIFGRIQDLDALQLQRLPVSWGAAEGGVLRLPKDQDSFTVRPGPEGGSLAQIEETAGSCEGGSTNAERLESSLSRAEFKQCEEAYSLRSFLNSCLMLPGSRRLSGGWRKKVCASADAQLSRSPEPAYPRGLPFLQWRGKLPKTAASATAGSAGDGPVVSRGTGSAKKRFSRSGGGYAEQKHEARVGGGIVQHSSRLLSLRRKVKGASSAESSSRTNVASTLSLGSLG
ncbi:uncharacterized protein EMH_0024580 [Eimeria mitis]|uniref:Uncharacterized protein n=1 Tax=Eimeria mitis TaxID=44415 RepID=U6K0P1_9EIME|nr:uncharacterized protein EMH_0024580 [Eimeria mitis]CDJ29847.1 hypothetical protein, conserved [Eimeria mitis]